MIAIIYILDLFIHQSHRMSWLVTLISHNYWLGPKHVEPIRSTIKQYVASSWFLFFSYHKDARSNTHQIKKMILQCSIHFGGLRL